MNNFKLIHIIKGLVRYRYEVNKNNNNNNIKNQFNARIVDSKEKCRPIGIYDESISETTNIYSFQFCTKFKVLSH